MAPGLEDGAEAASAAVSIPRLGASAAAGAGDGVGVSALALVGGGDGDGVGGIPSGPGLHTGGIRPLRGWTATTQLPATSILTRIDVDTNWAAPLLADAARSGVSSLE